MSSLIESLEGRQLFVANPTGLPDASFASGGVATVSFRSDVANDSAVPIDILTDSGGRTYAVAQTQQSVQVRRVDTFGVVDTTYASARGLIGLPLNSLKSKAIDGVSAALDSSDRLLLLAGNTVYRFTVSGKIDRTFGTRGAMNLVGLFSGAKSMAVDSGNRVYVVGSTQYATDAASASPLYKMRVARLRSSGTVDKTFATNGLYDAPAPSSGATFYAGGTSVGTKIRVASDGTVVAAANAKYQITDTSVQYFSRTASGVETVRFTAAGQPDVTFGTSGVVQHYQFGDDVNTAGEILVGIRSNGSVVTERYSQSVDSDSHSENNYLTATDGNPNHTFFLDASNTDLPTLGDAQFTTATDGSEFVVAQLSSYLYHRLSDATVDTTFTGTGTTTPIHDVTDIALPADGRVVTLNRSSKLLYLNVGRIFGSRKPIASLASKPTTVRGAATFSVVYQSQAGFGTHGAFDGSEITVTKPDGTVLHPSVAATSTLFHNDLTVRYRLSDSGTSFTKADDGKYAVNLLAAQATDAAGQTADARLLGSLTIAI